MAVLHAVWTSGRLHLWAEHASAGEGDADATRALLNGSAAHAADGAAAVDHPHPFALGSDEVIALVAEALGGRSAEPGAVRLRLPSFASGGAGDVNSSGEAAAENGGPAAGAATPAPSPRLAHWIGLGDAWAAGSELRSWRTPTVAVEPERALEVLAWAEEAGSETASHLVDELSGHEAGRRSHVVVGESVRFYATAARLGRALVAEQRFVPAVVQGREGPLRGAWEPWLSDGETAERVELLVRSTPPAARAVEDANDHEPASIVHEFLCAQVDALCRSALVDEDMAEALEDWDAGADPHVGWLSGLLARGDEVIADEPARADVVRRVRQWIGGLEDRGSNVGWRLALRLNEPVVLDDLADFMAPGADVEWTLTFHLQSVENERLVVDAEDVWSLRGDTASVEGQRIDAPQELLLAELGRASRLYKPLEGALEESAPSSLELTTDKAYEFLREVGPLLSAQGFGVIAPDWWDRPESRLGARLSLHGEQGEEESGASSSAPGSAAEARLGLHALVSYEWQLAIGDTPLTLAEFEKLAKQRAPLVRVGGRWVEVRREDIDHAMSFLRENPGGEIAFGEALRLAFSYDAGQTGLPILGIDASGWLAGLLGEEAEGSGFTMIEPPESFKGELRPYQQKGLSWLAFLDRLGLGPCLADDMGLGKTIQLIALLQHERTEAGGARLAPTLIVVPMSIVGNWKREAERFAPELRVLVHHGVDRAQGEAFGEKARGSDVVLTTYALAHRDRELLEGVRWRRVVLDEAQNIKNPSAKQAQAVRALEAPRRVALTGTPLENRLSELWSIMDFCNPGFLGTQGEFRRSFVVPVERYRDRQRAAQLRQLVRPFILRRLKIDPTVISDLPEKIEQKEYCGLTKEQAELYESCVRTMLGEVDKSEGIRRRGVVLTALIRLKQICNHPSLTLGEEEDDDGAGGGGASGPVGVARSGKCIRLLELLDEVIAAGDSALVFTQFRRMGHLLASMLRHAFDRDVLFLHGGTPQAQREKMIERFQKADGTAPIFLLSLKAGGTGLNLTAASHVFHFDRWWNPAVENQATDRAFRIGQTKKVSVHKFVVSGTLEERIDQMIESKTALAEDVIGSGEDWLTELSVSQLRDVLTLRPEAVVD